MSSASLLRQTCLLSLVLSAGCQVVQPAELVITGCTTQRDCQGIEVCCADQLCHANCNGVISTGCGGVTCPSNLQCANALCLPRDCSDVTCLEGETCANGGCVPNHCAGKKCAAGALCINGECNHASCAFVTCPAGTLCTLGSCIPTRCGSTSCPPGAVCNGSQCQDTTCAGLLCGSGECCVRSACTQCAATETSCSNGTDDDGDGLVDCADSDCVLQACNDADQCTSGETCSADGKCRGGSASVCTGARQCQLSPGYCANGTCSYSPAPGSSSCDDANPCTLNDVCKSGECSGVLKRCTTPPGSCFEATGSCGASGACEYTPRAAGAPCDDHDSCTTGERCDGDGACTPGEKKACASPGLCEKPAGTCSSGSCSYLADTGAACEVDGNPCTRGVCQSNKTCVEAKAPDGTVVNGPEVCCAGSTVNISSTKEHCGGCGTKCEKSNLCVPVTRNLDGSAMSCSAAPLISGRCGCSDDGKCPRGQKCYQPSGSGSSSAPGAKLCQPEATSQCAANQSIVLVTSCPPGGSSSGPAWCRYP